MAAWMPTRVGQRAEHERAGTGRQRRTDADPGAGVVRPAVGGRDGAGQAEREVQRDAEAADQQAGDCAGPASVEVQNTAKPSGVDGDRAVQQLVDREAQREPAADEPPEAHAGDQRGHARRRAGGERSVRSAQHVRGPQREAELHGDPGRDDDPADPVAAGAADPACAPGVGAALVAAAAHGAGRRRRGARRRAAAAAGPAASRARAPTAAPTASGAHGADAGGDRVGLGDRRRAAPRRAWRRARCAVQVTTNEPPNEQRKAPASVSGSAVNAVRARCRRRAAPARPRSSRSAAEPGRQRRDARAR